VGINTFTFLSSSLVEELVLAIRAAFLLGVPPLPVRGGIDEWDHRKNADARQFVVRVP
jgi:hypothetical protein